MDKTQVKALRQSAADMQFIAVLQACGFDVHVRAALAEIGSSAVYGTLDDALSLFKLTVAGADGVTPDTTAAAQLAEPPATVMNWMPDQAWKLREALLESGIAVTLVEPSHEMKSKGCQFTENYINRAASCWTEMMADGPGGREFDEQIAAALTASNFAVPVLGDALQGNAPTYSSTQSTNCAGCGKHKHTPLRLDAMGGYVCLTCIDKKLGGLLGEFGHAQPDSGRYEALAKLVCYGFDGTLGGEFGECDKGPYWMVKDVERALAAHPANGAQPRLSDAALDVLSERCRQIEGEGWTLGHDDKYPDFTMGAAAACYASQGVLLYPRAGDPPPSWPWAKDWWKPQDYRSNLVRAGALILAEIERLDRIKATNKGDKT